MSKNREIIRRWRLKLALSLLLFFVFEGLMTWIISENAGAGAVSGGVAAGMIAGFMILIPCISKFKEQREEELLKAYLEEHPMEASILNNTKKEQPKGNSQELAQSSSPKARNETTSSSSLYKICQEYRVEKHWVYGTFPSFSKLCNNFCAFAKDCGVEIEEETAAQLFAMMAATRAIWISCDSLAYSKALIGALKQYFGCPNRIIKISDGLKNKRSLIYMIERGAYSETLLMEEIYRAKFLPNSICITAFENAENSEFESAFVDFITAFRAPESENSFVVDYIGLITGLPHIEDKKMNFPTNNWSFFLTSKELAKLPHGCEEYSIHISVPSKAVTEPNRIGRIFYPISYARFDELVRNALDEHLLPLDIWKKLDKLEEYLAERVSFSISNPVSRQIEAYTSVLKACGMDMYKTLDLALSLKIMPQLKGYTAEQLNTNGETLAECIDGLFGMENLPIVHKMLTDYRLDK